ncbi:ATP-binding protein [Nonomuraea sp. NPDC050556]|uniref:sensor histidine kinase n=1 Tax=Nonomuraea sp. NPDC050556 TaxID=3364369 RepID=UPI0037ADB023
MVRLPLRIKLIALMLVLLALGMGVIGVVSVSVLHGYLIQRVDRQIEVLSARIKNMIEREQERLSQGKPAVDKQPIIETDAIVLRRTPKGFVALLDGRDVDTMPWPRIPDARGETVTVGAVRGDGHWRVRVSAIPAATFVIAVDLQEVDDITKQLVFIELLGGGGVLLLLAVVGITTVRRSMRPLAEIEHTAEAIAAGELGRRVPDGDPRTEVGRLAGALNGMLAQIEGALAARSASEAAARRSEERMRRFVADASHELRTPLTAIRGFAEYAGQNPDADAAELMQRIHQSAGRMSLLVDDLLLLARVDQQRPLQMWPVDMLALAAEAVQDARILAPDREIGLDVAGGAAMIVSGDEVRLRQVIGNLMTNALTHTPEGTSVTVRVGSQGDRIYLEVADKGPGLTAEQVERIFERFYRADSARSRRSGSGGSGLGLAIVQALVHAHNGTVTVNSAPGAGTTFRVELPLALE